MLYLIIGSLVLGGTLIVLLSQAAANTGFFAGNITLLLAFNAVVAVVGLKVLRIVLASDSGTPAEEFTRASISALRVISGSFLLGVACGFVMDRVSPLVRGTPAMPVLQIALVIIASMLAAQWTLSPLLALLVAGMTARARMQHALTVEPHLGSAGAVLNVLLFICLGLLFTLDGLARLWPWVLVIVLARLAGTAAAVAGLAKLSGLGLRQAAALTLALQPMSSLAVLLVADDFHWSAQLPGMDPAVMQALLVAAAFIDLDTTLLPDDLTLPLLWLGLIAATLGLTDARLSDAVWGAVAGYLSLWLGYWGFKLATRKEGVGYGDFKLFAALGAWFGWQALVPIILMASVIGALQGAFAVAAALVRMALPLLARRLAEWQVIFGPTLLAACALLAYPWMPGPLGMGACSMVLGVALGAVQPMVMSLLHEVAPIDRQGEAMALRVMTINFSSFLMPMLFGSIGAVTGVAGLFWLVCSALALGSRAIPALGAVASPEADRTGG